MSHQTVDAVPEQSADKYRQRVPCLSAITSAAELPARNTYILAWFGNDTGASHPGASYLESLLRAVEKVFSRRAALLHRIVALSASCANTHLLWVEIEYHLILHEKGNSVQPAVRASFEWTFGYSSANSPKNGICRTIRVNTVAYTSQAVPQLPNAIVAHEVGVKQHASWDAERYTAGVTGAARQPDFEIW